jgi:hypothetical protein
MRVVTKNTLRSGVILACVEGKIMGFAPCCILVLGKSSGHPNHSWNGRWNVVEITRYANNKYVGDANIRGRCSLHPSTSLREDELMGLPIVGDMAQIIPVTYNPRHATPYDQFCEKYGMGEMMPLFGE